MNPRRRRLLRKQLEMLANPSTKEEVVEQVLEQVVVQPSNGLKELEIPVDESKLPFGERMRLARERKKVKTE